MSDESEAPFKKRRKIEALAEHSATPMGTLIYRIGTGALLLLMGTAGTIFSLGLKNRADSLITENPTVQAVLKKADDSAQQVAKAAVDLREIQVAAREKSAELDSNLTRISSVLDHAAQQQAETSKQLASTSRDLAVLVDHVSGIDKAIDRHERALEKKD